MKKLFQTILPLVLSAIAILGMLGTNQALANVKAQIEDASNFYAVHLEATALGTATPLLHIKNNGSSESIEVENSSGTPVFTVDSSGAPSVGVGGLTVDSGGLTVSAGLATFAGGVNCTPQTETVTATFVITPTSCLVSMTSNAEYTSSTTTGIITTTATDGDIVILQNNNPSAALNIDGTGGSIECKANVALGAGDTLGVLYNGTDEVWNCLFNYDNS